MKKIRIKICTMVILLTTISTSYAQQGKRLTIADEAPTLKYGAWIKGNSIQELSTDQIYVLEFWATWCVPCMMNMPHLSALAEEYKGSVNFIGINVMERPPTGMTYSSQVPRIKTFVAENEEKMQFAIAVDNDDRHMEQQWLRQAGIRGIPATIVVKNRQIYWIGPPNHLDTILAEVVAGTYRLEERKAAYDKETDAEQMELLAYRTHVAGIDSAVSKKDYNEAIRLADLAVSDNQKYAYSLKQRKMGILLAHFPSKSSVKYLKEQHSASRQVSSSFAMFISTQENVSPKVLEVAADILEKHDQHSTYSLDCLALLQSKVGRFAKAVANQQQVLAWLTEGRLANPDLVSEEAIIACQKKIDRYSSKLKK